jgi:hypothetical protein
MPERAAAEEPWLQRVHPACRDFVRTVEELLERRRQEQMAGRLAAAYDQERWWPRSWHRTELEDSVYSSYKQMRQGRITRPPRRETVMEIADYLNCTIAERNRLLIAAHAAPVSPYLTGERLAELLPVAIEVASQLAIPAMVINRDWQIHYLNQGMLDTFPVSAEQFATVRPDQQNVLHLLFDPALPLHAHLIAYPDSWERMVRQTIYGFKLANLLCQHEPWYAELVEQLMKLPRFEHHWQTIYIDRSFDVDPSALLRDPMVTLEVALGSVQPPAAHLRLRPVIISVGYFQFDFPLVLAFFPTDPGQ